MKRIFLFVSLIACAIASISQNNAADMEQVRNEFRQMKQFFDELKAAYFIDAPSFCQLSEGMTDDYPIAIEEGSTIVRIGSMIFGERK